MQCGTTIVYNTNYIHMFNRYGLVGHVHVIIDMSVGWLITRGRDNVCLMCVLCENVCNVFI